MTLNRPPQHAYQLAKLANLFLSDALADSITLNEIILDNLTGPDAEGCATLAFHTVTYGYDSIKIINSSWTILVLSIMQKMHVTTSQRHSGLHHRRAAHPRV